MNIELLSGSASVFSPRMAASATFALNACPWFRRGRCHMGLSSLSAIMPMSHLLRLFRFPKAPLLRRAARGRLRARPASHTCPKTPPSTRRSTGLEQIAYYMRLRLHGAMDLLARVGHFGRSVAARRIGTYSKGMRQRVGFAQALHRRTPAAGPGRADQRPRPSMSRRDFYELLDGLAADGAHAALQPHPYGSRGARTDRLLMQPVCRGGRHTRRLAAQGACPSRCI